METFKGYVDGWTNFIGTSITSFFLTFATAIFFYAVVRFIFKRSGGDAKGLDDAKSMLGWSIIGLTVMFSIWGIVSFLQSGILGENANRSNIVAPSITSSASSRPASGAGTSGTGTRTLGAACTSNSQCITGSCLASKCSNPSTAGGGRGSSGFAALGDGCRIDTDCSGSLVCNAVKKCDNRGR